MHKRTFQSSASRRGIAFVVLMTASVIGAAGCDRIERTASAESATTSSNSDPIRIAALLPFAADQLIEIGVTPVAVPLLRGDVPPSWDGIPTIAVDHSAGPNLEQLMASDPDVVITSSVYAQFLPAVEQSTGAEIVVMDVDSVADVSGHVARLGEISGRTDEAAALMSSLDDRMNSEPVDDESVRVLAVFGTPHAFYAFLPSSYLGDLIAHAGGTLVTEDMQSHGVFRGLAPLSMESVLDRDPDHLLVIFHGPEESARAMLKQDALWGQLAAVRDDQVTFLKDDLYAMRPGSELPRAIGEIREIMAEARSRLP
ncbi:MAG: ABC transporter substrate-binding protein [Planctomycetota bacterium]